MRRKYPQISFFVFKPLCFRHTCPKFLLSIFASQIKLIQSVVGVSCQSQGPGCQVPMFQGRTSQVPRSKFRVPECLSPIYRGPRSQGPGFRVSGPDFRLYPCTHIQIITKRSFCLFIFSLGDCYSFNYGN